MIVLGGCTEDLMVETRRDGRDGGGLTPSEGASVPCHVHASSDSTARAYTGGMGGRAHPSLLWH